MRKVCCSTDKRTLALAYTQHCYTDKIVQGDGHNKQRYKDRIPSAALGFAIIRGPQRQRCYEKAHHKGASITHKDFRRWEIEDQKSQQCPCQNNCQPADKYLPAYSRG